MTESGQGNQRRDSKLLREQAHAALALDAPPRRSQHASRLDAEVVTALTCVLPLPVTPYAKIVQLSVVRIYPGKARRLTPPPKTFLSLDISSAATEGSPKAHRGRTPSKTSAEVLVWP